MLSMSKLLSHEHLLDVAFFPKIKHVFCAMAVMQMGPWLTTSELLSIVEEEDFIELDDLSWLYMIRTIKKIGPDTFRNIKRMINIFKNLIGDKKFSNNMNRENSNGRITHLVRSFFFPFISSPWTDNMHESFSKFICWLTMQAILMWLISRTLLQNNLSYLEAIFQKNQIIWNFSFTRIKCVVHWTGLIIFNIGCFTWIPCSLISLVMVGRDILLAHFSNAFIWACLFSSSLFYFVSELSLQNCIRLYNNADFLETSMRPPLGNPFFF